MQLESQAAPRGSSGEALGYSTATMLLWDRQDCIPLNKILAEDDIVVLLTPVVVPLSPAPGHASDPFEPLGRALAAKHGPIRHVPYTKRGGITETHVGFIKRAAAVIFVISGPPLDGQDSQAELAEIARKIGEERPQIIIACFHVRPEDLHPDTFPTIIRVSSYAKSELEKAAAILFGESSVPRTTATGVHVQSLIMKPRHWVVETLRPHGDIKPILTLWNECLPKKFHLNHIMLGLILNRDGYSMHYIVRDQESGEIVGFCATYTTFSGSSEERLIGSLALLLVRPAFRQRGVGLSLHDHALKQLKRTRGVERLQLGSTFPRLLYGLSSELPQSSVEWFRRRGWQVDGSPVGQVSEVSDWLLNFREMPTNSFSSAGLTFRPCAMSEFQLVLSIVDREAARNDSMGWYDQYVKLADSSHISDIILGLEGDTIVATALTYIPNSGSPAADDLPWAGVIGSDVGGVTCICIAEGSRDLNNSRDTIIIRLLDTCTKLLIERGMNHMFIDAVKGGDEGYQSLGFRKWASYKDLWRQI